MNRSLIARPVVTAVLTGTLLGAGAAVAAACPGHESHSHKPATNSGGIETAKTLPAYPSLTVTSQQPLVQQSRTVVVQGEATAVQPGTTVMVQQKQDGRWVTLPARTQVQEDGTYHMRVKLSEIGRSTLRMATTAANSAPFAVFVR